MSAPSCPGRAQATPCAPCTLVGLVTPVQRPQASLQRPQEDSFWLWDGAPSWGLVHVLSSLLLGATAAVPSLSLSSVDAEPTGSRLASQVPHTWPPKGQKRGLPPALPPQALPRSTGSLSCVGLSYEGGGGRALIQHGCLPPATLQGAPEEEGGGSGDCPRPGQHRAYNRGASGVLGRRKYSQNILGVPLCTWHRAGQILSFLDACSFRYAGAESEARLAPHMRGRAGIPTRMVTQLCLHRLQTKSGSHPQKPSGPHKRGQRPREPRHPGASTGPLPRALPLSLHPPPMAPCPAPQLRHLPPLQVSQTPDTGTKWACTEHHPPPATWPSPAHPVAIVAPRVCGHPRLAPPPSPPAA